MSWPATKLGLAIAALAVVVGGLALAVPPLLRQWRGLSNAAEQVRGFALAHRRAAVVVGVPLFILGMPLVAVPLTLFALLVGLVLLACFLSIIPIAGHEAGAAHIDDWVVGPAICTPLRSRDTRLQAPPTTQKVEDVKIRATTCVTVKKTGGSEYRGRVVFATFNAVVLYDPELGSVRRVSTEDASIEVIDKL